MGGGGKREDVKLFLPRGHCCSSWGPMWSDMLCFLLPSSVCLSFRQGGEKCSDSYLRQLLRTFVKSAALCMLLLPSVRLSFTGEGSQRRGWSDSHLFVEDLCEVFLFCFSNQYAWDRERGWEGEGVVTGSKEWRGQERGGWILARGHCWGPLWSQLLFVGYFFFSVCLSLYRGRGMVILTRRSLLRISVKSSALRLLLSPSVCLSLYKSFRLPIW